MAYIREDEAAITLTVKGKQYGGQWATYAGGDLAAAGSKTRPGNMGNEVSIGGPASRSDITLTTQFTDVVMAQHKSLEALVGHGPVTVAVIYLDENGLALAGGRFTRTGTLKSVAPPASNAGSAVVGMYTVVVECDELAS